MSRGQMPDYLSPFTDLTVTRKRDLAGIEWVHAADRAGNPIFTKVPTAPTGEQLVEFAAAQAHAAMVRAYREGYEAAKRELRNFMGINIQ